MFIDDGMMSYGCESDVGINNILMDIIAAGFCLIWTVTKIKKNSAKFLSRDKHESFGQVIPESG